jgi:type IV secretion system protein TrbB
VSNDDTVKQRAREKLRRDMGPIMIDALADPCTVEVVLNADGRLWQERLGERLRVIGQVSASRAEAIVKTVAGYHGKEVTRHSPTIEAELPIDGSRFAGQLPPVVAAPIFAIRKRAVAAFTLADYVATGVMNPAQCSLIETSIRAHRNILVIGGTGSGKTTLVNAIIGGMVAADPFERLVIIEDTGEIQCPAQNYVQYHTTPEVSMTALLRTTLRMRPDRILVGEVRGPEALDLLMAWNTGHAGGAATLHANDAKAGLTRLAMLISMRADSPRPIEPLIAEAVHLIVHIARTPDGRRVESLLEVQGWVGGEYRLRHL